MNNKIVLGTVQFGLNYGINNQKGELSTEEVFDILNLAHDSNLNILDTAAAYGNAEERIGQYLELNRDKTFKIITKFDLKNHSTPAQSLEKSLQNLRVDNVNTVMFHSFEDFKSRNAEEIDYLLEQKGKKYNRLGISLYTNDQILEIAETNIFEVVQIPFNILDNEIQRGKYLRDLKKKNIEIHIRSVFLQGLFFMDKAKLPSALKPLEKYLDKIESIASSFSIDISVLAMQYVLSKAYIDNIIIGVDSADHLRKNLENLKITIPVEAIKAVDDIFVTETSLLNPSTWHL